MPTSVPTRVPISFTVDPDVPPVDQPIHEALRSVSALEMEAGSPEVAELYAELLVAALERAGN